ncbi:MULTISPECIES: hypothetical protein [unclassified Fusibacter]|uniref:hypothetical protein n=1 Tax=unclassified Fusibacter TaxID=2624464 RepID=UPI0010113DF5|nr:MULTISPECIES: hypothetical protein [unclassified Fusibacter]MCK8061477.1 hypothetical protein [Fusibacter sp. A2]NPE23662.1 hypothetical protein [Fusibacter sp. A1]RXV58841.1 hypothetical protein DWB64_17910 [Fusibacter sp. A1]
MTNLPDEIDKRLNLIDFNELWPGFKRYEYALYDDEHVILNDKTMERDQRFMGNTSICYEGEHTICGYDPMKMQRFENWVYHKSFLGINDGESKEFIMGPIVTESEDEDFSRVSRYYRRKS